MNIDKAIDYINQLDKIHNGFFQLHLYGDYTGSVVNSTFPLNNFIFDNMTECEDKLLKLLKELS